MPINWPSKSGHNKRELTAGTTARVPSAIKGIKAIGDSSHTNGQGMIFFYQKAVSQDQSSRRRETRNKPNADFARNKGMYKTNNC